MSCHKYIFYLQVMFSICQVKRNKELVAVDIFLINAAGEKIQNTNKKSNGQVCQGFIAALKDGFGFIETVNHDKEIFFHYRLELCLCTFNFRCKCCIISCKVLNNSYFIIIGDFMYE